MKNIFSYLKKYRNVSFLDKEFNEVDAAICSLIPYLDFKDIVSDSKNKIRLGEAIISFLMVYKKRNFIKKGFWQKDLVKLAKLLQDSQRYSGTAIYGYVNKLDSETQFSALSLELVSGEKVIAFKGTDISLVGWKEDFSFAYEFPNKCQKAAIKYVNKYGSMFDKDIILLGHSKGGHLALVSGLYANIFIKKKIRNIYSFDGPGLRTREFESKRFKKQEKKIVHVIPEYSIVGLFLKQEDEHRVVKTNRKDILSHSIFTWEIDDDRFLKTTLSNLSENLKQSIMLWLDNRSLDSIEKIVNDVFDFLEANHIDNVVDLIKVKSLLTLFRKKKEIDEETRAVISSFIKFNYDYKTIKKDEIKLV